MGDRRGGLAPAGRGGGRAVGPPALATADSEGWPLPLRRVFAELGFRRLRWAPGLYLLKVLMIFPLASEV